MKHSRAAVVIRSFLSFVFSLFIFNLALGFSTFVISLIAKDRSHDGENTVFLTWGLVLLGVIIAGFTVVAGFMSASIALVARPVHALVVGIIISLLWRIALNQEQHHLSYTFRLIMMWVSPMLALFGSALYGAMMRRDRPVTPADQQIYRQN